MRVEMLRSRGYRGEHLGAGFITDMDDRTAREFIAKGWAKEAIEPPALTAAEADALIPVKTGKRRAALR